METKICRVCEVEKPLESFYKCAKCIQGRMPTCKICDLQGKKVEKEEKIHQFNLDFRRKDEQHYILAGATPNDYEVMWEILGKMGYNCHGDIHQQFLDRFNFKIDVPMEYKKKKHTTTFDVEGKYHARDEKKNPTKK